LRITTALNANWKFVQDDNLTDKEALSASGNDWETVNLPHTWNANDAASLNATGYKRGLGWYRLALDTPSEGVRHWLEFNGASMVADVWLNGEHLGQHGARSPRFASMSRTI
jgi:beta-galactosidase